MIKKIKASTSEKIILVFLIILTIFSISFFTIIKNKCLFVTNLNPNEIKYNSPQHYYIGINYRLLKDGTQNQKNQYEGP